MSAAHASSHASDACALLLVHARNTFDPLRCAASGVGFDAARAAAELAAEVTATAERQHHAISATSVQHPAGEVCNGQPGSGRMQTSSKVDVNVQSMLGGWRRATQERWDELLCAHVAAHNVQDSM